MIEIAIKDLERKLLEKVPSALDYFNPGTTREHIISSLSFSNDIPDDLVKLYEWRDGCDIDNPIFLHGFTLMSLKDIQLARETNIRAHNEYPELVLIKDTYIPILRRDYSELVLYNNDIASENYGRLHSISPMWEDEYESKIIYDSLESFLLTTTELYQLSLLPPDFDDNFYVNKIKDVRRKLNPASNFGK